MRPFIFVNRPSLFPIVLLVCLAASVSATPFKKAEEELQLGNLAGQRRFGRTQRMPAFMREVGSKDAGLDPALQNLSMEDLYRMLALLDLVEESGVNYDEKISPKDLKTLGYLVEQYT